MTNNRKSKIFTLPVILYIVSQIIMLVSMISAIIFISFYIDTENISWLIASLVLLLIGNFGINCDFTIFTKTTKKEIYRLVLRALVSYVFFCLVIFAVILKSIFLGILAVIAYFVLGYIWYKQDFIR